MMDFDKDQRERQEARERALGDRTFTLRGETFTYIANARFDVLRRVSELGQQSDGATIIKTLEDAVLELIEDHDGAHERFRQLCEQTEFPVTFNDLNDVATWLIEQVSSRPTQAPSSSPDTHGANGTTSTDISSSPQEAVSQG